MSVHMATSYPKELEKAKKEHWPVILPIGTIEYHSTHCPYGCDALVATGLAEMLAQKRDCVILPTVWYGVSSYAVGGPETNTINMNIDTFEAYIYNILKSLFKSGFTRNICIINCHQTEDYLPNALACMKAAKKLIFEYLEETQGYAWWGDNKNADFYQNVSSFDNPWNWIRIFNGVHGEGFEGDHAGKYECSMLEALYPGSIKLERLKDTDDWFAQNANEMSVELGKKAEIIFSTYNWGFAPEEDRLKVIERLPDGITIEPTWDMFHQYRVGDSIETVVDYSLSFTGPGEYFTSEAIAAKKRDIKLYTNSQTLGRTWDFGVIPYEPMPGAWAKRYEAMLKANKDWNLTGITETIHYGFYPSIIAELEKEMFFTGSKSPEEIIDALITRDYGENAPKIKEAMSLFDEAITYYVPTNEDQYGAFRIGPSYPFWIENSFNKGKRPDEMKSHFGSRLYYAEYTPLDVNFHHEKGSSLVGVRIFDEIKSNEKMRNLFARGIAVLKSCSNIGSELQKLIALAQFMHNTTQTVINNKNFFILKQKLNIAGTKEKAAQILDEIKALLRAERKNTEDTIAVVNADSRLGWEPSMEYTTDEKALRWKIRQIDYSIDYVLMHFKEHNNYIDKFSDN